MKGNACSGGRQSRWRMKMIECAGETDRESIIRLWNTSFGDSFDWIKSYYANRTVGQTLVYRMEDGVVAAMLEMLPVSIQDYEKFFSGFYIYAACTLPNFRGQGLMHALIEESCRIAQRKDLDFASLIPQTRPLVAFYEKQGFCIPIKNSVWIYNASRSSVISLFSMSEDEFVTLKECYERQHSCVMIHDRMFIRLIYRQVLASGGSVLKINHCDSVSYAICFYENNSLKIQEISSDNQTIRQDIDAICHYFQTKEAAVVRAGEMHDYGRIRPLNKCFQLHHSLYMNTMLE